MAKVFRLHAQGANTIQDWGTSTKYSTNAISQIADPNGASASKEITSIPSPFARMDLVKTAFKEVVDSGNLDGATIYHKMVSDSLDVGQLFFEIDKHRDKLEIIVWDKQTDLQVLINSDKQGHKLLGETLNMFLIQDASTFNFNHLQRIYLLNFKNGPALTNIIGATSPATLFFTSANDISYVSKSIQFGNDFPFDSNYKPLYDRDLEYQKVWYLLRLVINNFSTLFPEVDNYLNLSFTKLTDAQKQIISALTNSNIGSFNSINVNVSAGNLVEVIGHNLYCRKTGGVITSDFEIQSNYKINGFSPLVLPIDTYVLKAKYTHDDWDRNNKAPVYDPNPIDSRILPFDGTKYPYLTISDFLEDTIIRLPYEFNNTSYFDGHYNDKSGKSYLLPIKNLFFDYFTKEQLIGQLQDGKNMFEFVSNAAGITVILRIPIKIGYIEYHRTYFKDIPAKIDRSNNSGGLIEKDFAFALFPNVEFPNKKDAVYRFGLISDFTDNGNYKISCFKHNQPLILQTVTRNESYREYRKCQTGILDGENFDYIQLHVLNKQGIVVPKYNNHTGTEQFTFAIDFGTTNTHVEYSVNGSPSKSFDIIKGEEQIQLLTKTEQLERYIFDYDFVPESIGKNDEFKFPMRTALSEARTVNWNTISYPLAHANIPFPYEKRNEYKYNKTVTGLKWSNDADNIKRVKCYIESLFIILRNKVILNNGDLQQTKIVWFYPISMTRNRFNLFKNEWDSAYKRYFNGNSGNIIPITESIAPYEYYSRGKGISANMATIDIGGGTSDIVISENGKVKYITSFRFAANSIFGNGYGDNSGLVKNGIVQQFKPEILKLLKANSMEGLSGICNELDQKNDSGNLASFFFSLNDNKLVGKNIDFNNMLRLDESQKIVFIFFYTAIIYHLASIMKLKNIEMPRYMNFSGNGSKVLHILTTDPKLLEKFTKVIFEKVYDNNYHANGLTISEISENPKEATCKGGISCSVAQSYDEISETKVVLVSKDQNLFVTDQTYSFITKDEVVVYEKIEKEVRDFVQFTFSLNKVFSFSKNFGVDNNSLLIAESICFKDLKEYTKNGISLKLKEVSDADIIEEPLFFYPLNGVLIALSNAIYEHQTNN